MTLPQAPTEIPNAARAVATYGEFGRSWIEGHWRADPLADAVAAESGGLNQVRAALEGGIDSVVDPSPALVALFAQVDTVPDWVDHAAIDRACDSLVRHTAAMSIVLGAASLLSGATNAVAGKPLVLTGRYGSQPGVRSIEVGSWLKEVVTPGGMRRDGAGFAATVRVRMIHATVRRMLDRRGVWDEPAWGVPIPQPYMAFTMAEFGHIALKGMHDLGVRLRQREIDDIYHLWRYVAYVIGVEDELAPRHENDYLRIEDLYRIASPGPDDFDREFVFALTDDYLAPEIAHLLPGPDRFTSPIATRLVHGLTRRFLGRESADLLGVPDGPERYLIAAVSPGLAALGHLNSALCSGPWFTRRAYANREKEFDRVRRQYGVEHQMVDDAPDRPLAGV